MIQLSLQVRTASRLRRHLLVPVSTYNTRPQLHYPLAIVNHFKVVVKYTLMTGSLPHGGGLE